MKRIITLVAALALGLCCRAQVIRVGSPEELPYINDLESVEVLGRIPIFFEHGSLEVRSFEATEVREVIKLLDAHKDYMIMLRGWCSPADSDKVNEYRSFHRANAVGKYLVNHGLDGRRIIDMDGMGTDKTVKDKNLYDMARRVDILIVKELKENN